MSVGPLRQLQEVINRATCLSRSLQRKQRPCSWRNLLDLRDFLPLVLDGATFQVKEALEINFPTHDVVEFLGDGPLRSQLETFATASLVVAPHGAGLANIIVSALHTPVLEIGSIQCPPCFLRLALKVGGMDACCSLERRMTEGSPLYSLNGIAE